MGIYEEGVFSLLILLSLISLHLCHFLLSTSVSALMLYCKQTSKQCFDVKHLVLVVEFSKRSLITFLQMIEMGCFSELNILFGPDGVPTSDLTGTAPPPPPEKSSCTCSCFGDDVSHNFVYFVFLTVTEPLW